jgi:polygalacturonase
MAGEAEIPNHQSTHNVKSYGAKGDGRTDDSNAFLRAIADMDNGDVLRIPAGK